MGIQVWIELPVDRTGAIEPPGDRDLPRFFRAVSDRAMAVGGVTIGAVAVRLVRRGLLDMVGNVMEWTRSSFKRYSNDPAKLLDDQEGSGDIWPVMRGGAYNQGASGVRCAVRHGGARF